MKSHHRSLNFQLPHDDTTKKQDEPPSQALPTDLQAKYNVCFKSLNGLKRKGRLCVCVHAYASNAIENKSKTISVKQNKF